MAVEWKKRCTYCGNYYDLTRRNTFVFVYSAEAAFNNMLTICAMCGYTMRLFGIDLADVTDLKRSGCFLVFSEHPADYVRVAKDRMRGIQVQLRELTEHDENQVRFFLWELDNNNGA